VTSRWPPPDLWKRTTGSGSSAYSRVSSVPASPNAASPVGMGGGGGTLARSSASCGVPLAASAAAILAARHASACAYVRSNRSTLPRDPLTRPPATSRLAVSMTCASLRSVTSAADRDCRPLRPHTWRTSESRIKSRARALPSDALLLPPAASFISAAVTKAARCGGSDFCVHLGPRPLAPAAGGALPSASARDARCRSARVVSCANARVE